MKPVTINLTLSIDDEIDAAIWGGFYSHTRSDEGAPFVQLGEGRPWIPVVDWKDNSYGVTAATLRRVASHFIEIGKHIKDNQP